MRRLGLIVAAACAPLSAHATDLLPDWMVKSPPDKVVAAAWPRDAAGKVVYGSVELECDIVARRPSGCTVLSESPPGRALGAAALSLAPSYRVKDLAPPPARARLTIAHDVDTGPVWTNPFNINQIDAVAPTAAKGRDGRAVVSCTIGADGVSSGCAVTLEQPEGLGFGQAVLNLTQGLLLTPAMREGKPVSSTVNVLINFEGDHEVFKGPKQSMASVGVATSLPWLTVPSAEDVKAAFPRKATGKISRGDVVQQCAVTAAGLLADCVTLSAGPTGMGFELQARRLASKFTVEKAALKTTKLDLMINLHIQFLAADDPGWTDRRLTKIVWDRTIDYDAAQAVYPPAAAKAGVTSGSASVDCAIGPGGALTDCAVFNETPPDLGFAKAATTIASAFVANPWTEAGLPAEGARIRMPIKMVYDAPKAN